MEKLRILALALRLENFTASELAVHAGASLSTVRSLMQREPDLFVPIAQGERLDAASRPIGRPAKRYRLTDPSGIRRQLEDLQAPGSERELASDLPIVEDDLVSDDDELDLTLSLAEGTLRRVVRPMDPGDRELLTGIATRNAERVLLALEEKPDEARRLRALAVRDFSRLLSGKEVGIEHFASAAALLAVVAKVITESNIVQLLAVLVDAAGRSHQTPPIGIVAPPGHSPEEVMPGLAGDWTNSLIEGQQDLLWVPRWASELAEPQLLAGVVVGGSAGEEDVETVVAPATVDQLAAWKSRLFITGSTPARTRRHAVDQGAFFLPGETREAIGIVRNSLLVEASGKVTLPSGSEVEVDEKHDRSAEVLHGRPATAR
jgi:hypothetical protein